MSKPSRERLYRRLVRQRKADMSLKKYHLINPSETRYDCNHLGSYAQWAGDLYADVLVVLPDFRCVESFIADRGKPVLTATPADEPHRWKPPCNAFLLKLLRASGRDIGMPDEYGRLPFCIRQGFLPTTIRECVCRGMHWVCAFSVMVRGSSTNKKVLLVQ